MAATVDLDHLPWDHEYASQQKRSLAKRELSYTQEMPILEQLLESVVSGTEDSEGASSSVSVFGRQLKDSSLNTVEEKLEALLGLASKNEQHELVEKIKSLQQLFKDLLARLSKAHNRQL